MTAQLSLHRAFFVLRPLAGLGLSAFSVYFICTTTSTCRYCSYKTATSRAISQNCFKTYHISTKRSDLLYRPAPYKHLKTLRKPFETPRKPFETPSRPCACTCPESYYGQPISRPPPPRPPISGFPFYQLSSPEIVLPIRPVTSPAVHSIVCGMQSITSHVFRNGCLQCQGGGWRQDQHDGWGSMPDLWPHHGQTRRTSRLGALPIC
ncbi:hypothetical protein F5Y03DRAFT_79128 [Xylaria venustula]|nr:hypothetical protein F5Y03DRAFT_79128 [Xylaria venustula]